MSRRNPSPGSPSPGPGASRRLRARIPPAAAALILLGAAGLSDAARARAHYPPSSPKIRLGGEIFLRTPPEDLKDRRLGLVINHTSRLSDGTPLLRAVRAAGMTVAAIFTPEHGFDGSAEAGRDVAGGNYREIPVYSLYDRTRRPRPDQVKQVDAFVYDIQDVGTRFYTYITTLKYVMEAASAAGIPVYVLDRPNPLGGEVVEGPCMDPAHESFIGSVPVPVRYGLTIGELALMMRGEGWVPRELELHVCPMESWRRGDLWADTGLTWIPTSPNIPTADTALMFPGTGLLGGIILNQGLGTPLPFLQIGAPWLEPAAVAAGLPGSASEGLRMEPTVFTPRPIPGRASDPPYADRRCRGFKLCFVDRAAVRPVRFTLELIRVLKHLYPDRIYTESQSLTRMYGTDGLELYLKNRVAFESLVRRCEEDRARFMERRAPYLLYR